MFGRHKVGRQVWSSWWWLGLLMSALLTACGEDATPTPNLAGVATPIDSNRPTVTPPFQAATNITPEPSVLITTPPPTVPGTNGPNVTPTGAPNTPILRPTPTSPTSGTLTSDDLGIGVWSDTEALWSPKGDIFLLHVMRENSDGDFFYLIRPPDSVQSSFKLPRSVYSTMQWSPDGRYLSYIDRASDNATSGPVKLIDTQRDITNSRKFFTGPCTGANWQAPGKLIATCGLAIYLLSDDTDSAAKGDNQDPLFKLDNNRFPGSNVDLSLLFNALPSPDGTTLAVFGLRRQNGPLPLGEIAFYNIASKKVDLLDRNNRPVTIVDWTPDSKYLILRNITGDQAITYTFDYYLADPVKLKITQNLTKSNDKCDPVLGAKPECQGTVPATVQSSRIVFAPDGDRYFFTSQRYVSRPNSPLAFAERLTSNRISSSKPEQLIETQPGERIIGLSWLPNGHYFYSVGLTTATAKAFLDGKQVEVTGTNKNAQVTTKSTPVPTKAGAGSLSGFAFVPLQATSPSPEVTATTVAATTPAVSTVATTPSSPAQTDTAVPAATATATQEPATPTPTSLPRGTSLLGFETVTAQARTPTPIPPTKTPDPNASVSPTPQPAYPRPAAYYMSPAGNWLLVVERVAAADKVVQYQVRLVPYVLK